MHTYTAQKKNKQTNNQSKANFNEYFFFSPSLVFLWRDFATASDLPFYYSLRLFSFQLLSCTALFSFFLLKKIVTHASSTDSLSCLTFSLSFFLFLFLSAALLSRSIQLYTSFILHTSLFNCTSISFALSSPSRSLGFFFVLLTEGGTIRLHLHLSKYFFLRVPPSVFPFFALFSSPFFL